MKKITHKMPAARFGEAYPMGNGRIGAAVYGSFPVEKIALTENTFYSGSVRDESCSSKESSKEIFYKMRELIQEKRYEEAHKMAEGFHGSRGNYGTHLPTGELQIHYFTEDGNPLTEIRNYSRTLDYMQGMTSVQAAVETGDAKTEIQTETFVSHPHKALVWKMKSDKPLKIRIAWKAYHDQGDSIVDERGISFTALARETIHCDQPCGVDLYGRMEVKTEGSVRPCDKYMEIQNAKEVVLYLVCGTDFEKKAGWRGKEQTLEQWMNHIVCEKNRQVSELGKIPYSEIREKHMQDISEKMNRVELKIEGQEQVEAYFQYGRYLLLSSSREDSVLPTQLQGIWNDDVACRIGWTCDMHLDINTQMNYWIADTTRLEETLPPLTHWVKKLAKEGKKTAEEFYGLPGWSAEVVSNAWCYSAPYWAVPLSPYPTGGAWILENLWEHWRFCKDEKWLREELFPLVKDAVTFFSEYVFRDEKTGKIGCGPSISAENSFAKDGKTYFLSNSCTYEIAVIRELFSAFLEMTEEVKDLEASVDEAFRKKVRKILEDLPPYRILTDGTLAEWEHDFPSCDSQHRHTSHLIGLFPFSQIIPWQNPKLAQAAEQSIRAKLTPYQNWEDTGWARSLLLLYEARLGHGEQAWFHVKSMMEDLSEPNGMIYHPPTRGTLGDDDFGHVYELDGNTGLTAGITEMLLQSHNGRLNLIPAIPKAWKKGSVKGLAARGGKKVSFSWEDGRIISFWEA